MINKSRDVVVAGIMLALVWVAYGLLSGCATRNDDAVDAVISREAAIRRTDMPPGLVSPIPFRGSISVVKMHVNKWKKAPIEGMDQTSIMRALLDGRKRKATDYHLSQEECDLLKLHPLNRLYSPPVFATVEEAKADGGVCWVGARNAQGWAVGRWHTVVPDDPKSPYDLGNWDDGLRVP